MKKFFTNSVAAFCAIFLFTVATNAQTVIWEEQFDGGFNGWTEDTISTSSDSLSWKWTNTGEVGPLMLPPDPGPITSATAANGAAYVNYEYWRFGADLANVPDNPAEYGNLISHLVSPSIDMSAVSGPLNIRFSQLAKLLNTAGGYDASSLVAFSVDGGVSWSADIDCNPDLPIREVANNTVTLPIPSDFGLQGASDVKIRFTYANDFYYWMIDDVQIVERKERNMQANTNFYGIAPNYATPAPMVESFPFVVDIENVGGQTETGVNVNVQITDAVTGAVVYEENKPYGTITPDSLAENAVFGSFTPAAQVGAYTGVYTVSADSADADLSNNSVDFNFEVTERLFAKEAGNGLSGVRGTADNSWSMGNVYYITQPDWMATNVTFGVSNASDIAGQFMTIKLLKWEGDLDDSGMAEPAEYTLETFNGYTFDGTEDGQVIEIPIDLDGNPWPLEQGTHYIVMMEYTDVSDQFVFFLTTTAHDYSGMVFATDSIGANRYAALLDVGNSGDLSTGNFTGGYYVPAVRMNIGYVNSANNLLPENNIISVFPNPTSDQLNLDLELVEMTDVLEIKIADITGKVHMVQQYENIQRDRISFDLKNYPTGSYLVHLTTKDGIRALPFMVQH